MSVEGETTGQHDGRADEGVLDELEERWFAADEQKPTVEELCDGRRHLIDKLRARIAPYLPLEQFRLKPPTPDAAPHWPEVPNHKLISVIGRGGMGWVFKAEQLSTGRHVAVKLLPSGEGSTQLLRRFRQEVKLASQLKHPGIVPIYEAGNASSQLEVVPYFTMEYVEGLPLHEYARAQNLTVTEKVNLLIEICDAVAAVHARKWVHRDLKPSNIMVTPTGKPRLLDFGVARAIDSTDPDENMHTATGQFIGTRQYASPEQIQGSANRVDVRTDVHALGLIAYELLSGQRPYEIDQLPAEQAVHMILEADPPSLSRSDRKLRGDLETIVFKAMSKDPVRRYADAGEMRDDLARFLRGERIHARPDSTWYRLRVFTRRNRTLVGSVIAIILALAGGLAVALYQMHKADRMERETRWRLAGELETRGVDSAESGDPALGLLYLARAIALFHDDAVAERDARSRYGLVRSLVPTTLPADDVPRLPHDHAWVVDPRIRFNYEFKQSLQEPIGTIEILDDSGNPRQRFHGFTGNPHWMEISPDGKLLAVTEHSSARVRLFDLDTGRLLREGSHTAPLWASTFSSDSRSLFIASWNGEIYCWDGNNRWNTKPAATSAKIDRDVTFLGVSPDSSRLAILSDSGWVEQIDPVTGSPLAPRIHTLRRASCLAYSPDGRTLAVGALDGTVQFFDSGTAARRAPLLHHNRPVGNVRFHEGRVLVWTGTAMDGAHYRPWLRHPDVFAWQVLASGDRMKLVGHLSPEKPGYGAWMPSFDTESTLLIRYEEAGRMFEATHVGPEGDPLLVPGQLPRMGKLFPAHELLCIAVSSDKRICQVIDTKAGTPRGDALALLGKFKFARIDRAGRRAAILQSIDGTESQESARAYRQKMRTVLQIFDLENRQAEQRMFLEAFEAEFAFSNSGNQLLLTDDLGAVLIIPVGDVRHSKSLPNHPARAYRPIFSSDDSKVLTFCHGGIARLTDLNTGDYGEFQNSAGIFHAQMTGDARIVVLADDDHQLHIFDPFPARQVCPPVRFRPQLGKTRLSDDGSVVIVTFQGGGLQLYSTRTGMPLSPKLDFGDAKDWPGFHFDPGKERIVITDKSGAIYRIDYSPVTGSAAELQVEAERLSGRSIDASGALIRVNAPIIYPSSRVPSPEN